MLGKEQHIIAKYRARFLEERFARFDINYTEAPYLVTLSKNGKMKMNQLGNAMPFHKSHLTRSIRVLENHGYLIKTVDPEDQRGYLLEMTDKGKDLAKEVLKIMDDWDQILLSTLTEEELTLLKEAYQRMIDKLQTMYDKGEKDEKNS